MFVAIGVMVLASLAAASSSLACSPGGTCHGVIRWTTSPSTVTGGLAAVNAAALNVPNPSTNFVNHEMWVATNSSNADLGPFVEEGLKFGSEAGVNQGTVIFWAEWNTNFQFVYHHVQFASLNTTYNAKISYSGSNRWGVYLNGTQLANTSAFQPCCSIELQVGGETTYDFPTINATATSLQKRNTSNIWSYNWGGGPVTDGPNNHLVPTWITTGASMRVTGS